MLTKVEARNSQGSLMTFELDDVSDGLALLDVGGLDPVKASLVASPFAKLKGKQYHTSHIQERNILIEVGLEADYVTTSVEELRDRLYAYFMTGEAVNLRLYRDTGLVVEINGVVESCEAPLFSDKPKMDISILCFYPDFVTLDTDTFSGETVDDTTETTLVYPGNASSGFIFTLNVDRSITQFTFYFRPSDGTLRTFDFASSLVTGDILTISTIPGAKYAKRTRTGVTTSVLYGVSPQSNWHELLQGSNHIRVYAEGDPIPYTIEYFTRYGGL